RFNTFIPANPTINAIMNASIRASGPWTDRLFPKGVLNRNDKTTMKTVEPIKKGDNFRAQINVFFFERINLKLFFYS
ncbi:MAG: hypothetical protein WBM69_02230, partial [Desulfobacterales bacterium]